MDHDLKPCLAVDTFRQASTDTSGKTALRPGRDFFHASIPSGKKVLGVVSGSFWGVPVHFSVPHPHPIGRLIVLFFNQQTTLECLLVFSYFFFCFFCLSNQFHAINSTTKVLFLNNHLTKWNKNLNIGSRIPSDNNYLYFARGGQHAHGRPAHRLNNDCPSPKLLGVPPPLVTNLIIHLTKDTAVYRCYLPKVITAGDSPLHAFYEM